MIGRTSLEMALMGALIVAVPFGDFFVALFGTLLLVAFILRLESLIMPGSMIIIWQYVALVISPALDGDYTTDETALLVCVLYSTFSHLLYILGHRKFDQDKVKACLCTVNEKQFMALLVLSLGSMAYLVGIGAFQHLAGKVQIDAGGKGIAGNFKSLFYVAVALFALGMPRWSTSKRSFTFTIMATIALLASISSGRKEEFAISSFVFVIFYLDNKTITFRKKTIYITAALILAQIFFFSMYRMRSHLYFYVPGYQATIVEVITDAIDGRNLIEDGNSGSPIGRLNHQEPTARYLNEGIEIVSPQEVVKISTAIVVPGFLKDPGPISSFGFYAGHRMRYGGFYGDTSTSVGPIVEAHNFFGWIGVVLIASIPLCIDRMLSFSISGPFGLILFWQFLLRSLTYERTLFEFLVTLPVYVLLMWIIGLVTGCKWSLTPSGGLQPGTPPHPADK